MKRMFLHHPLTATIATILVLPSLYFLAAAFMNYGVGIEGPWNLIAPIVTQPDNNHLGLNLNMLIVFGPVASLVISLFEVATSQVKHTGDHIKIVAEIKTRSYYWFVILASAFCMACMFLYYISENCNCH